MESREFTVKIDPGQMAQFRDLFRQEMAKARERARTLGPSMPVVLPPESSMEGWHETTTLSDLGRGVRTFVQGETGSRRVAAIGVEMGKARAELHALKASLLELADTIASGQLAQETNEYVERTELRIAVEIRKRVGR
jgi:hypothetical protein